VFFLVGVPVVVKMCIHCMKLIILKKKKPLLVMATVHYGWFYQL